MTAYAPEGLSPLGMPTPEMLRHASGTNAIFQAVCVKCDEYHNLHVDLGAIQGLIPRQEAAMDIAGRSPKEIAVLSRVGKPVSFQVLGFTSSGTAILSRRCAQEEAAKHIFSAYRPGDILPAVVQSVASFGVFCDIGCGCTALMTIDRISTCRLSHCSQRFSVGQKIFALILSMDNGKITLTHRELLGTWAENAAHFRPRQTVFGIVRGVQPYGTFIELTPNLSGLADTGSALESGQPVSVYIRSITPQKQKIKLTVLEALPAPLPLKPLRYYKTSGHIDRWEYAPGSKTATYFGP